MYYFHTLESRTYSHMLSVASTFLQYLYAIIQTYSRLANAHN